MKILKQILFISIISLLIVFIGAPLLKRVVFKTAVTHSINQYPGPLYRTSNQGMVQPNNTLRNCVDMCNEILESDLTHLHIDAQAFLKQSEYYNSLLREHLRPDDNSKIDFIGMIHPNPIAQDSLESSKTVRTCHNKVLKLLKENRYPVVGAEGYLDPDLSLNQYWENWSAIQQNKIGTNFNQKDGAIIHKVFNDQIFSQDATLMYKQYDSGIQVTGTEEEILLTLSLAIIHSLSDETISFSTSKKYLLWFRELTWLRTEIAIAKVKKSMLLKRVSTGVVVMGSLHADSFQKVVGHCRMQGEVIWSHPIE